MRNIEIVKYLVASFRNYIRHHWFFETEEKGISMFVSYKPYITLLKFILLVNPTCILLRPVLVGHLVES